MIKVHLKADSIHGSEKYNVIVSKEFGVTAYKKNEKTIELYIAQDGPRTDRPDDKAKIQAVRDVIKEMVDWPCNLRTHYSEINLGCGRGPYEAMSWFFRNVEKGIILEDDIFPHPLFWNYMENLLERYKNDDRIGMVTAHNLHRKYSRHHSYYFSLHLIT